MQIRRVALVVFETVLTLTAASLIIITSSRRMNTIHYIRIIVLYRCPRGRLKQFQNITERERAVIAVLYSVFLVVVYPATLLFIVRYDKPNIMRFRSFFAVKKTHFHLRSLARVERPHGNNKQLLEEFPKSSLRGYNVLLLYQRFFLVVNFFFFFFIKLVFEVLRFLNVITSNHL